MIPNPTLAGAIHGTVALLCIAVGLMQILRPKRGAGHRARGYFYVYAMLVADGLALLVYQVHRQVQYPAHVGAIANLICIVIGIVANAAQPASANLEVPALLLDRLVLCRAADRGGADPTRDTARSRLTKSVQALGHDICRNGYRQRDRLYDHRAKPADFRTGRAGRQHDAAGRCPIMIDSREASEALADIDDMVAPRAAVADLRSRQPVDDHVGRAGVRRLSGHLAGAALCRRRLDRASTSSASADGARSAPINRPKSGVRTFDRKFLLRRSR